MYDSDHNVDPEDDSSTPTNNQQMENDHTENNDNEIETNFPKDDQEQTIPSQSQSFIAANKEDQLNNEEICPKLSNESSKNDPVILNKFPEDCLNEIEHLFKKPRWAIQVPYKQFEKLLDFAIKLVQSGQDEQDEVCQRFLSETIIHFFARFCLEETSDAFREDSKPMIGLCFKLVQIIVLCLKKNNYGLMDLLSHLLSISNRYSFFPCNEKVNYIPSQSFTTEIDNVRFQKSLFIQLINHFGHLGGFDILLSCFQEKNLSAILIFVYLKPFNNCIDFLSSQTLETYFAPILKIVPSYFENLSDEDLKKELKSESKNDLISLLVRICKTFALKMSKNDTAKLFEFLRLKLTLRVLRFSSFSGKMNALNEINKTILYYNQEYASLNNCNNESVATPEEMAQWLIENNVLELILKDCLHQPQYVEKLDNIIRFLLKENALSLDCLDKIWNSQLGKHEIIVKNIHELIAKLAWNFSADQLNHLFLCFKSSWSNATKKEREKLLELMRRLAEDDKDGSMAFKVLSLLWNIAYNDDEVDSDIVDQALSAHLKILDYSKFCDKDSQKFKWLQKCIDEIIKLEYGNNVITAMKQIREICMLFPGVFQNKIGPSFKTKQLNKTRYEPQQTRNEILRNIEKNYDFATLLIKNLATYMQWMRNYNQNFPEMKPNVVCKGRRFSHIDEVQERLDFFKFFLQEGELWLCATQANEIWNCLAQNAIFPSDRRICFQWFSLVMDTEPDLDPNIYCKFLESNITKLDSSLVDIYGVECFEKFFKAVNLNQNKLVHLNQVYYMQDSDLTGLDYLWKLILFCEEEPASKAINLLKDLYSNLGLKLANSQLELHHDLINTCFDRLKASYDTVSVIEHDKDESKVQMELNKMTRVLSVLCEYINKCDGDYNSERALLPMLQCFRGKQVFLSVKIQSVNRTVNEEFELRTHTNETLISIKNKVLETLKITDNIDIDFYHAGEKIDFTSGKLVSQLPITKKKLHLQARLNTNTISSSEIELIDSFKGHSKKNLQKQENTLPGVIVSKKSNYTNFLLSVADLAMSLKHELLREKCLLVLKLIPPDMNYVNLILDFFINENHNDEEAWNKFEQELLSSPTKTVYLLGIIYTLLVPANNNQIYGSQNFQTSFISNKYCLKILNYLNDRTLLSKADNYCKISALLMILKINKFTLSTLCCLKMLSSDSSETLKDTLKYVPYDITLRNVSMNVAQNIFKNVNNVNELNFVPNSQLIDSALMLAWYTATGFWHFNIDADISILHNYFVQNYLQNDNTNMNKSIDTYDACHEALELSTIMLMLSPQEAYILVDDNKWNEFFVDLLLLCPVEAIKNNMLEQFTLIFTKCVKDYDILESILDLMFNFLQKYIPKFYQTSRQFFQLFCNLLEYAYHNDLRFPIINNLLQYEYDLLYHPKKNFCFNGLFEETLLEGHLKITKELISFLNSDSKFSIGCNDSKKMLNEVGLVYLLLDQYLFTASKSLCLLQQNAEIVDDIYPVCPGSKSLIAAYELLVALCNGCVGNLENVCQKLETYMNTFSIFSWEYFLIIGTRPVQGFVGLKNAGATCYMNSVLQQLFMIPEVRNGILSVEIDSSYHFDDSNEENYFFNENKSLALEDAKTYNIGIFKQIQIIFGHLLLSQCQYYVPKGFWQHFKLFGGPINLREQQDALEFFNNLFDSLDEALKVLGQTPIMSNIFGGSFSDQKICKDCPHRYCREESFTTLNVDVHNHHSLSDSLEQYVRGDLLEGDNAYYCEKCDRKVNTVKRLCIKKLPKVLVIQLKRFDYDYEREVSIKFNDYFEFPRLLNMEPYTVNGLARKEGEIIEEDQINQENDITQYELSGIVVHSGQANGGHYFSYILHQNDDGQKKWYKFDDIDVNECKLDQDEDMKMQCFGGEYVNELFDQNVKKMTPKMQKRTWNAFILVYRKVDDESKSFVNNIPSIPLPIRKNVQHQNIIFMHQKTMLSGEFYHFMKSLFECNIPNLNSHIPVEELEKITLTTLNIAAKFLFTFCFRAQKQLRNSALEWYEVIIPYLKINPQIRKIFIKEHLYYSNKFEEFLLECPAPDVRVAFSKIVIFLTHYSLLDKDKSANEIMCVLVNLIHKEVPKFIKHSSQYFHLFYMYATLGVEQRNHLLSFDVPFLFMSLIVTDQQQFTIKSQYIDFKLYQVVSILVRCCDTSHLITSHSNRCILPNPYKYEDNNFIMQIPENIHETLFENHCYMKRIIKDAITLEENRKLLKFCCWENQSFSKNTIEELLRHISNSYTYELDPYFSILYEILLIEDSWHEFRVQLACIGDDFLRYLSIAKPFQKGLFEMIHCQFHHFEKRTYQCVHLLINLFHGSNRAINCIKNDPEIKAKWIDTIKWLYEELSKKFSFINNSPSWSNHPNDPNVDLATNFNILLSKAKEMFFDDEKNEEMMENQPMDRPSLLQSNETDRIEEDLSEDLNSMDISSPEKSESAIDQKNLS